MVASDSPTDVYEAARTKFFEAVERSLFEEGELRTLKSLKEEYLKIRESFGILTEVSSAGVKDCLINEFGTRIVIQRRYAEVATINIDKMDLCVNK